MYLATRSPLYLDLHSKFSYPVMHVVSRLSGVIEELVHAELFMVINDNGNVNLGPMCLAYNKRFRNVCWLSKRVTEINK